MDDELGERDVELPSANGRSSAEAGDLDVRQALANRPDERRGRVDRHYRLRAETVDELLGQHARSGPDVERPLPGSDPGGPRSVARARPSNGP